MKKGGVYVKKLIPFVVVLFVFFTGCRKKPANNPPSNLNITASSTSVAPGAVVNLKASATDPDGDILTFSWSMTAPSAPVPLTGPSFSSSSGEAVDWTAPQGVSEAISYTIVVEASDGKGGTAQASTTINVVPEAPQEEPPAQ